jgi:hypothetical protein
MKASVQLRDRGSGISLLFRRYARSDDEEALRLARDRAIERKVTLIEEEGRASGSIAGYDPAEARFPATQNRPTQCERTGEGGSPMGVQVIGPHVPG